MLVRSIYLDGRVQCRQRTCSTSGELNVATLHAVELLALGAFRTLFDHAVAVRELSVENVAEDFGIAVRVGRKSIAGRYTILVENAQTAKVVEAVVIVTGETEGVEAFEPAAVFGVPALTRATGDNGSVGKRFGHNGVGGKN